MKRTLDREGVPTPGGARFWSVVMIRKLLKSDLYKPHTYAETRQIVSPGVAATLNEDESYGVSWFGRRKVTQKQVAENGVYRTKTKATIRPQEEQIAVPTPDSGIPRALVDAAREAIKDNRRSSSANHRFWELSGGLASCGLCGGRMPSDARPNRSGWFFYYRCARYRKHGTAGCTNNKRFPALEVEARVWDHVRGLLTDAETLHEDLERMVELTQEGMRGDSGREVQGWFRKIAEADRKRDGYLELAADGILDRTELKAKLATLDETRKTAERELAALRESEERVAAMERDKEAVIDHYATLTPDALDALGPEDRHQLYKILKPKVMLTPKGPTEVSYALTGASTPLDRAEERAPCETTR